MDSYSVGDEDQFGGGNSCVMVARQTDTRSRIMMRLYIRENRATDTAYWRYEAWYSRCPSRLDDKLAVHVHFVIIKIVLLSNYIPANSQCVTIVETIKLFHSEPSVLFFSQILSQPILMISLSHNNWNNQPVLPMPNLHPPSSPSPPPSQIHHQTPSLAFTSPFIHSHSHNLPPPKLPPPDYKYPLPSSPNLFLNRDTCPQTESYHAVFSSLPWMPVHMIWYWVYQRDVKILEKFIVVIVCCC